MFKQQSKTSGWAWFIVGAIIALALTFVLWGVQVNLYGYRIHHYWLLVLVPVGLLLTFNRKTKGLGFFLIGFGLIGGLTDFPDLYNAIVGII